MMVRRLSGTAVLYAGLGLSGEALAEPGLVCVQDDRGTVRRCRLAPTIADQSMAPGNGIRSASRFTTHDRVPAGQPIDVRCHRDRQPSTRGPGNRRRPIHRHDRVRTGKDCPCLQSGPRLFEPVFERGVGPEEEHRCFAAILGAQRCLPQRFAVECGAQLFGDLSAQVINVGRGVFPRRRHEGHFSAAVPASGKERLNCPILRC